MSSNHDQPFRPLRGGVSIFNPNVGVLGTLGFIATSDGIDRWIVSAFHVLCSEHGAVTENDPIQQPAEASVVARVRAVRSNHQSDIAAARIDNTVASVGELLGIGVVRGAGAPAARRRVAKSGAATGVTEGVIQQVSNDSVVIEPLGGFPSSYDLTLPGDSGAAWIDLETRQIVALHLVGNNGGQQVAHGISMTKVSAILGLRPV
jgi:hypothetical protein